MNMKTTETYIVVGWETSEQLYTQALTWMSPTLEAQMGQIGGGLCPELYLPFGLTKILNADSSFRDYETFGNYQMHVFHVCS